MRDNPEPATDEEAILRAFVAACPRPSAQDIIDWVGRYPAHAEAIRETAEIALEIAQNTDMTREPSASLIERTRRKAEANLAAAFARRDASKQARSFVELMAAASTSVPELARELEVGRAVLTDLVQGRMLAPLPGQFAAALAGALQATIAVIQAAAELAAARPQMGHARSNGAPAARQRPFAEIVGEDPTMTDARKRFWLAEG